MFDNYRYSSHLAMVTVDEENWFSLSDLASRLNTSENTLIDKYMDSGDFTAMVVNGDKLWFANSTGLFKCLCRANSKNARVVQEWVYTELLPQFLFKVIEIAFVEVDEI